MPKSDNQKLKIFHILDYLERNSHEKKPVRTAELIAMLDRDHNISCDRKTVYSDIAALQDYGVDIVSLPGKNGGYYIASRNFELPELKLLVDSVQSAKFITDRKSKALIKKLESLVSKYQATKLQRQVSITGRIKTMNESIYYNVDKLHDAISRDRRIRFQYYRWNVKKEMELRKNGGWYEVSPWGLMWDDENYYLIGFDAEESKIKHYRVDKMLKISLTRDRRLGRAEFQAFDLPRYTRSLFGMYGGEEVRVTMEAHNDMVGVLIDRFGKDIPIMPVDDDHFRTSVNVAVSNQFLGWIFSLGSAVQITGPESVVQRMREEAKRLTEQYL
jgi:predicted DNA-binding transcriptional regulator YafY